MSADGFIARPDGKLDWLAAVQEPAEDYGYQAFFDSVDSLVIGRKTFELALGFEAWPYSGKRCIVLTHRPLAPSHGEPECFGGTVQSLVQHLQGEGVKHLYVDGGTVIRQFLSARLINHLTLSVVPVLLGRGIRLFGERGPQQRLTLQHAQSWPTGLTQLRYRVGDDPASTRSTRPPASRLPCR